MGWYNKLKEAIKAVEENYTDINEMGYYPFVVIEKIPEGVCPVTEEKNELWFKWIDKGYKRCEKPVWSEGIIVWAF